MRHFAAICLFVLLTTASSWADTVYTYTGNPYNAVAGVFNSSERITGSFATADPLAPNTTYNSLSYTNWSFSNGYQTFNQLDPSLGFTLITDSSGNIGQWIIFADDPQNFHNSLSTYSVILYDRFGPSLSSLDFANYDPQPDPNFQNESYGETDYHPGNWTVTTTPEPSSLLLLTTGSLSVLGTVRRRRFRAHRSS